MPHTTRLTIAYIGLFLILTGTRDARAGDDVRECDPLKYAFPSVVRMTNREFIDQNVVDLDDYSVVDLGFAAWTAACVPTSQTQVLRGIASTIRAGGIKVHGGKLERSLTDAYGVVHELAKAEGTSGSGTSVPVSFYSTTFASWIRAELDPSFKVTADIWWRGLSTVPAWLTKDLEVIMAAAKVTHRNTQLLLSFGYYTSESYAGYGSTVYFVQSKRDGGHEISIEGYNDGDKDGIRYGYPRLLAHDPARGERFVAFVPGALDRKDGLGPKPTVNVSPSMLTFWDKVGEFFAGTPDGRYNWVDDAALITVIDPAIDGGDTLFNETKEAIHAQAWKPDACPGDRKWYDYYGSDYMEWLYEQYADHVAEGYAAGEDPCRGYCD